MTTDAATDAAPPPPQVPTEELRLALVLNGGVSLAVWMGGVALEIQRLTEGAGYGPVLGLARTRAITDVISGTSAGGINGAALALAQVNSRADLRLLRGLWSDQGRMEDLLRQPFRGQPSSLLRGDDYFLPELRRALRSLAVPFARRRYPDQRPTAVDLTITTTLLAGSQQVTVDDLGQDLPQRLHDASLHFEFTQDERTDDAYAAEALHRANAMALAARATASFPFAFEPVYLPVNDPAADAADDLGSFASWVQESDQGRNTSRFAVDGGVLANTPTQAALRAIDRRGAEGPVRRAMLLVFPHAPGAGNDPADRPDRPPTTVGGLTAVLGALQSQGGRTYVDRIEEHNKVAADWRGGRLQVLGDVGEDIASLFALARVAWPHYHRLRKRRAALDLATRVPFFVTDARRPFEHVRRQAYDAQCQVEPCPYVPEAPPPHDAALATPGWRWGFTTALGIADAAAEVLRSALGVASAEEAVPLSDAVALVTEQRTRITTAQAEVDGIWRDDPALHGLDPSTQYWRTRLYAYRLAMHQGDAGDREAVASYCRAHGVPEATCEQLLARHGAQGAATRAAVLRIVEELVAQIDAVLAIADGPAGGAVLNLQTWRHVLTMADVAPADRTTELTLRLLALDVAVWLVADGPATGTAQPIKLVQLSLRAGHPWVVHSDSPDAKAAGTELARFGGFLKRSWRMNDWWWGRLDAAMVLCRTVLDPERLYRVGAVLGADPRDVAGVRALAVRELDRLAAGLLRGEPEPSAMRDLRAEALEELVDTWSGDQRRSHLPALAAFAAYPIQARIALEELPVLAAAIRQDDVEGASKRSRGLRFLAAEDALVEQVRTCDPARPGWLALGARALAAFDAAGVGREPLADETGSDALVRTTAKAAGVLATVADSPRFGIKAVRPATGAVRGAVLLPYWVVNGLAGGGPLSRMLAALGLVAGGLLLALGLFGMLGWAGPVSGTVGAATLLAAIGYSALRTGSLLHGVALLGPVVPLAAYALNQRPGEESGEAAGGLLAVLVLAAALYLLARIPWPLRSPRAHRGTPEFRRGLVRAGLTLLVLAAVGGACYGVAVAWAVSPWWPLVIATVVALGAGLGLSWSTGKEARRWRPTPAAADLRPASTGLAGPFVWEPVDDPDGVAASWAAVYGAGYVGAAWLLWWAATPNGGVDPRDWNWVTAALAAWSVMGLALLVVAPPFLVRRSWRRIRELVHASGPLTGSEAADVLLLRRMVRLDVAAWHFCEAAGTPRPEEGRTATDLRLTAAGRELLAGLPRRGAAAAPPR